MPKQNSQDDDAKPSQSSATSGVTPRKRNAKPSKTTCSPQLSKIAVERLRMRTNQVRSMRATYVAGNEFELGFEMHAPRHFTIVNLRTKADPELIHETLVEKWTPVTSDA